MGNTYFWITGKGEVRKMSGNERWTMIRNHPKRKFVCVDMSPTTLNIYTASYDDGRFTYQTGTYLKIDALKKLLALRENASEMRAIAYKAHP